MTQRVPRGEWLTVGEVQRLVQDLDGRTLTRGMLQHYAQNSYVRPRPVLTHNGERGRPSSVGYSFTDVVLLRWLVRLAGEGVSLKQFKAGIRALRKLLPQALDAPESIRFFIVRNKKRRYIAVETSDKRQVQLTGAVGQVLLSFSADELVPNTVRRAKELISERASAAALA